MQLVLTNQPSARTSASTLSDGAHVSRDLARTARPAPRLPELPGLPDASTPGLPARKFGGPPAEGSRAARADMAAVKAAQLLRTPEGDAWARRMSNDGTARMWIDLARRHRALEGGGVQGWLDAALVASTLAANGAATAVLKHHFKRLRPFEVDPTIRPPFGRPGGSSYPSGHASSAFAAARVISVLRPDLAAEAYDLARQVAASRVYAGVHFPSDVVAGAALGTAIGELALRQARQGGSLSVDPAAVEDVVDQVFGPA
ncbi:MAG: ybjG [Thermoleophilia bacterium]|nr:ybjG [Thermoleophilia bacterium]